MLTNTPQSLHEECERKLLIIFLVNIKKLHRKAKAFIIDLVKKKD